MPIRPYRDVTPRLGRGVFVAPGAEVIGDVVLGDQCSVWYGAVIRGDVEAIRIGARTNIQDRCVVHVTTARFGTTVGDGCTVGHGAILHGCTIGDGVLVGMGAIVLDGCVVEDGCIVGAGALLPPGKRYPARSLLVGSPARVVRALTPAQLNDTRWSADHYIELARRHESSSG